MFVCGVLHIAGPLRETLPPADAGMNREESTAACPFSGWEPFVPHLVHPLKVAIVEALSCVRMPLSAVQFGKVFAGAGDGFRESNVRYHLDHLTEIGVLEVVPYMDSSGSPREKFFYFACVDQRPADKQQNVRKR